MPASAFCILVILNIQKIVPYTVTAGTHTIALLIGSKLSYLVHAHCYESDNLVKESIIQIDDSRTPISMLRLVLHVSALLDDFYARKAG